ncbi:S1 RNA-binding domain-containing protein [Candidatus Woesearchaeota archaeon]|nr:S1 RNA-binding domain-containing protein [Candidatus Woesearchaeota archaeon]
MLYQRTGWPEESEIVLCTVTKIFPNAVFATLDEYSGKSGLIHISEVSPGRIRNIRDFVVEGRKVVCKVLAVRQEKGHIDLSLRRVNEMQKKQKSNALKMEQKAEKLTENLAKQLKMNVKDLYTLLTKEMWNHFDYVHECFDSIVAGEFDVKKLKLDSKTEKALVDMVNEKIKLPEVEIKGVLSFQSWEKDGIDILKNELTGVKKGGIEVSYLGSGQYKIIVRAPDYDLAEKKIKNNIQNLVEKYEDADKTNVSFARQ